MERYSEYKDSGIQWLGEIPSHWEVVPLKYYTDIIMGQSPNGDDIKDNGHLLFMQGNSEFGRKYPSPTSYCDNCNKKSRVGDILMSVRAPVGALNVSDKVYGIGRGLCSIKPVNIQLDFLWYYLIVARQGFKEVSTGSTYDSVSTDTLRSIRLVLPTIEEQQAIASYLDSTTAKIDEAIAQQQKMIDLLNERKQIIINNAVTKGLNPDVKMKDSGVDWIGEIPEHWEIMQYRHLFENLDKLRMPITADQRSRNNPQYDYYGASGVIDKIDYYNVEDKVLLIGEDGANLLMRNLPLIYKAEGRFWVNNHAHILKPLKDDYDFMAYVMEAADYTLFITGSAQPKLSQGNLNSVKLPIPPIDEQYEIVNFIRKRTEKNDFSVEQSKQQISLLQERKQIIINDVVTGKVKVL